MSRRYDEVARMPTTTREQMGEVHVRVRLSNAMDVEMAERGLLERDRVRTCEVDGLADSGAARSVILVDVANHLGLLIRHQKIAQLADGREVPVGVSGPMLIEIYDREVFEEAFVLGNQMLLGQTALESMDLLVDCASRKVIPNPAHPEGPVWRI